MLLSVKEVLWWALLTASCAAFPMVINAVSAFANIPIAPCSEVPTRK